MLRQLIVVLLTLEGILSGDVTVQRAGNSSEPDAVRARQEEIIEVTKKLLMAITNVNYDVYKEMCDSDLTSFEPESQGILVQGMEFHRYLMENVVPRSFPHTIMVNPVVHMMGEDAACIAYIRLTQTIGDNVRAIIGRAEETRVWHRRNDTWHHIHFHRSGSTTLHTN